MMTDQPNPHPNPPMYEPETEAPASGMAIAAMILGIVGLCLTPLALVAIILGVIVLASNTPQAKKGKGYATTGVVLGGTGIVIVPIVALLIAILLPAVGAARNTARRMQNSTQIRGIHQAFVTFSYSNKDNFAGLHSNGQILVDGPETGFSGNGSTPQARYWTLFDGQFITPDYAISPLEIDLKYPYAGGPVSSDHYSYAMLQFLETGSPSTVPNSSVMVYAIDPATAQRAKEWRATLNSQAIVMSDRNTGTDGGNGVDSIHGAGPGAWSGSVVWNDNHVGFENTHVFNNMTKYGHAGMVPSDNLFEDDPGTGGANAVMVHD